jgi:hypothetical protein
MLEGGGLEKAPKLPVVVALAAAVLPVIGLSVAAELELRSGTAAPKLRPFEASLARAVN